MTDMPKGDSMSCSLFNSFQITQALKFLRKFRTACTASTASTARSAHFCVPICVRTFIAPFERLAGAFLFVGPSYVTQ